VALTQVPWEALEERTCEVAPFTASEILQTHSQLSGLIAGFALAGFILLLNRGLAVSNIQDTEVERRRALSNANAALLLALSAIAGLVAAFLYSSISGFHCLQNHAQYPYASTLLTISAVLLVAGVSVAAASQRELGHTANALRTVLLIGGVVLAGRVGSDLVEAHQFSHNAERFIDRVGELPPPPLPAGVDAPPAGSTAFLDEQLGSYAEDQWPESDPDEWPMLLATDLFDGDAPARLVRSLVVVSVLGTAAALAISWAMNRTGRPGPQPDREEERQEARKAELARVERVGQAWRLGLIGAVTCGSFLVVVTFITGVAAYGDRLAVPPWWHWTLLFAAILAVLVLAIQPPRLSDERPLLRVRREGRRRT
jgi:hypothetical protein